MKFVKTPEEYEKLKRKFLKKIDKFLKDYNEFLDYTSPYNWTSSIFSHIENYRNKVKGFKPLTMDDLENEFVRDQIFNDEEKEYWNTLRKYNI